MSKDRNCKMCVYYSENGCSQFNCQGTTTVDDIRAEERSHIVGILFGIDRQVAELVKEILNNEKAHK